MKKFFALLLTLAMVLSLAACGGKKEEAPAEEAKEPEQTETQESAESAVTTVTAGKLTVAMSSTPSARTARPPWPASMLPWLAISPITWAWSWRWSPLTSTAF